MCYSGQCIWEGYMGNCNFPKNSAVRDKYPHPVCEIGDDNEEDAQKTKEAIADIKNILKNCNLSK